MRDCSRCATSNGKCSFYQRICRGSCQLPVPCCSREDGKLAAPPRERRAEEESQVAATLRDDVFSLVLREPALYVPFRGSAEDQRSSRRRFRNLPAEFRLHLPSSGVK